MQSMLCLGFEIGVILRDSTLLGMLAPRISTTRRSDWMTTMLQRNLVLKMERLLTTCVFTSPVCRL